MHKPIIFVFLFFYFSVAYSQPKQNSRPQTPQPPFAYIIDTLTYSRKLDSLQYGVTITRPEGKGPFASIIMITGSGPQDRDETILNHKPFAVMADYFTRMGYLVMRVDDRGVGRSGGKFAAATTFDFAGDVESHLDFLLTNQYVDKRKIGLLGHSEGGMIAPIVAGKRKDISFIVLMAAPGIPIAKLMAEQNQAILHTSGIDSIAASSFAGFFEKAIPASVSAPDTAAAARLLLTSIAAWRETENPIRVRATTGIYNDSTTNLYVSRMLQQIYNPWFRVFINFDPQPYLQKLSCKVLAVNGSRDVQVISGSNLAGIKRSLEKSAVKRFEVAELSSLNHLFQTCKLCTVQEYGMLTETISPVALDKISQWLKKEIPVQ